MQQMLSLADFERPARRRLPRQLFRYISSGAEDECTLRGNRDAFSRYAFVPRMLTGVADRHQSITLFGHHYTSPFGIAPVGLSAMWAYRGDTMLARAAHDSGIPAAMSGASLVPMEEVASQAPGTWFQAYVPGDMTRLDALLDRIGKAEFQTLVVTVDMPVQVNPENYLRSGFSMPLRPSLRLAWDGISHPRWLFGTFLRTLARHGMPHFENWRAERGAPILARTVERDFGARDAVCWEHLKHVRLRWPGTLIVKGILAPDDAARASGLGADGLIISNHGGRQIDGAVPPLFMLPKVVRAAGGATVMLDGGVRRGTDVLKALALGARCVFLGRPFHYAAAAGGVVGVLRAVQILREEVDRDMALLGINDLGGLDASILQDLHHLESD